MDREIIFLVEEPPEGGYTARALGHAIFTEADTWEDLRIAVQDAVRCHFEEAERPKALRPLRSRARISGSQPSGWGSEVDDVTGIRASRV